MNHFKTLNKYLSDKGIVYNTHSHEIATTSIDSARLRNSPLEAGAKALFIKINKSYYLVVIRACDRLDTKKLKLAFLELGIKVKKFRFMTTEELFDFTGLVPGSVPPFTTPFLESTNLIIDRNLQLNSVIFFNAASLVKSISMSYDEYMKAHEQFEILDIAD